MPNHASTIVIAWKKLSRRSELLAKALNTELWFFPGYLPYAKATFKTLFRALHQKPRIVIVQLPQGPLLLEALFLRNLTGCRVVADVHTGFLLSSDWKGLLLNAPFVNLLHYADFIVAHNETELNLIPQNAKDKTIVVLDPWHYISTGAAKKVNARDPYVVFPASFASDEPLQEVINAINRSSINVKMYITGNWKRKPNLKKQESRRIKFTGYLPNEEFSNLIANATGIVTGTTREYTSLMSGWEAIAYNKPLAVTNTRTLKGMFQNYAIFYDWKDTKSISHAIKKILSTKPKEGAYETLKESTVTGVELFRKKLEELSIS
jgi:glycosyltransferase involved in cell wall biosynthesis